MDSQHVTMEQLQKNSLLDAGSSAYLENLYDAYLRDPNTVPTPWRLYFEQLAMVDGNKVEPRHLEVQKVFKDLAKAPWAPISHKPSSTIEPSVELDNQASLVHQHKQTQVNALIDAYRLSGHLQATLDPLQMYEKPMVPELMLSYYYLSDADLDTTFDAGSLPGATIRPLRQIMADLKRIYCETTAFEFMHIPDLPERIWVQEQIEKVCSQKKLSIETQKRILEYLTAAEGLEKYLGAKYPGAKRFSLEGCDTLILSLDTIIQEGGLVGAKEIVICMAHRGRLNILVNLFGKLPSQLFDEFEGKPLDEKLESGDVKYHQGFSSNVTTLNGPMHLSLAYNPSHLEIVGPVICGSVRARQERRSDFDHTQVLPIAIHGDASFAGQGVVMETLNMSQTRGFKVGGTIHIIVNNQIGFTTSDPREARSTLYCSDIGKMLEVPILHVNADDAEAIYRVTQLALAYRTKFKKDLIIDLVGYRRQGHNEADEPAVTQPIMYQRIRSHPTVYKIFADKLVAERVLSADEVAALAKQYRDTLDSRQSPIAARLVSEIKRDYASDWQPYITKDWRIPYQDAFSLEDLKALAEKLTTFPEELVLHPRVQKVMADRRLMTAGKLLPDWGYAETLAYATLLTQGYGVRLSGQDTGRGTFFHRHAELHNQVDGTIYVPLAHLSKKQSIAIVDSLLSEAAVLAFEYGYSTNEPKSLVIWEAQFGDFANNAQVVIDQFISSGEQKWGRHSGLTLLLPHGYEGQGPEHSSARLERYLQLCAQHNMQVCVPSSPAQIYHLLRRQVLRSMRKPLIVLTPKSLLRHKLAVSTLDELATGTFLPILPELDPLTEKNVNRIILCSGKIYYELLEKRREDKRLNVAILRIEQLYPFPELELQTALKQYPEAKEIIWCQEEPKNQGAWYSIQHNLMAVLLSSQTLRYTGRAESAAPAVGYHHLHQEQQTALVQEAFS